MMALDALLLCYQAHCRARAAQKAEGLRWVRHDEWIEFIRLLLAGERVSYEGTSMVQGLTAAGTPDDVLARIQRYRDAGVKLPIVRPAAVHQTRRIMDLFS